MKKSQRFQTIVDIKRQQEHKALKAMGEQQQKMQAAKEQLAHLQQYRQDYLNKDADQRVKRVSAILEFRAFIAKLDRAINGQETLVAQLETELQRKRRSWEGLHHQAKNFQKVQDGMAAVELKQEDRREQREVDDRTAQMHRNKLGGLADF